MIAQLTGVVAQVGPTSAVIEVGGFGVQAVCSPNTVADLRLGQRATLATSLVVREDSLTLYGFASADEREFFELLLSQELRSYCWGDCSTNTQERFEKAYELPDIVNSKRAR